MSNDLSSELNFALSLADLADAITLPHFTHRTFNVDLKENLTEVTEVDRNTETAIVNAIKQSRPQHYLVAQGKDMAQIYKLKHQSHLKIQFMEQS